MLFNSVKFLLFFLPATLVLFYLAPRGMRLYVLLVASFIFYASAGLIPFYFMVAGIVWIYIFSRLNIASNKLVIALGVSFPFLTLIMFRYLEFIFDNFHVSDPMREPFFFFLSVALPAGISFYSFQMMCYVVDVRRKHLEPPSFIVLANYISFFPQLVAGPIVRLQDVDYQFRSIADGVLKPDFRQGTKLIAFGLLAKVFLADLLYLSLRPYEPGQVASFLDSTFIIFGYSFRIYLDFWAYSTIAVGLGKLFSVNLPRNFLEPYFANNPQDFWRRWHVTLSYWLRDYVYLPLGGNKSYARNILIVFSAVGLWHGAGWNFVVWGIYHGVLVASYKALSPYWDALPVLAQRTLNFVLVSLAWPLFFLGISDFLTFLKGFYAPSAFAPELFGTPHWILLGLAALWVFGQREKNWLYVEPHNGWFYRFSENFLVKGVLIATTVAFFELSQTFIYFRF